MRRYRLSDRVSKMPSGPTNSHLMSFCWTVSRSHAVSNEPAAPATVLGPKRRFRFGVRSLIGVVLFLGLVFGWLARMQRQVAEQDALVAELARDRVVVNSQVPNWLCLALNL